MPQKDSLLFKKMNIDDEELEGLMPPSAEEPRSSTGITPRPPTRRFYALTALSLLVGYFMFPQLVSHASPSSVVDDVSDIKEGSDKTNSASPPFEKSVAQMTQRSGPNPTFPAMTESPSIPVSTKSTKEIKLDDTKAASRQTCEVPATGLRVDKAPKLTSNTSKTVFANCAKHIGKRIGTSQRKQTAKLYKNKSAHVFSFPNKVKNSKGQRPYLCVPQKNGNKQFGGLVFGAWNMKAATSGEGVDEDMGHWQYHSIPGKRKFEKKSHVYFVARNPYSRILSLFLQKVKEECISEGQKGCNRAHAWRGFKPDTLFKDFVKSIGQSVEKHGSPCAVNHHLCKQVESCLTNTLSAEEVTVIRLEEQSCWFPCLAKELRLEPSIFSNGWEQFSGQSCYYTATGDCNGE